MNTDIRISRTSGAAKVAAILGALIAVILIAAPYWAGRADMRLMGEIFLYLALASLWNLLAGYAGLVSVGQQAYVGFGGYMLFALTIFAGLPPLVAIALAGVLGALISIPVAALIFRLRGAYFAIGTWVMAEVFRLSFAQVSALGGGSGTSLPTDIVRSMADGRSAREALSYWLALGAALIVVTAVYLLLRSRKGLALTAIRDNELASASLGIDIWRTKFFVYVVTSGLTSVLGGALTSLRVMPACPVGASERCLFEMLAIWSCGRKYGLVAVTGEECSEFVLRPLRSDSGGMQRKGRVNSAPAEDVQGRP
ncbi:branched-chain amino acid ABC transporter permease [Primorskyibacter flagellatus]|uniref:Branched-chain amino acid transport system permease protein n=1 Tax=Primorskyibacter flagellatus TaxID=1387277 RepID=A0A1W2E2K4_9RHOB|nr:branched-chain amino acid ABC transporter permease [Primorskyibacter flagellatus]SMD03929.1 branched-chain amino acid transport system permease protein [Primorskyibacter flagellatus]